MTDRYLLKLWRDAVLARYYHRCAFCEVFGDEKLDCHHIVKRRHVLTRYEVINGIPLCHACHAVAHTLTGAVKIQRLIGAKKYEWLMDMELETIKDYLARRGISRVEWMKSQAEKLKAEAA